MSATEYHADPLREATAHGVERAVRLASIAAASVQVLAQVRAHRHREQAQRVARLDRAHRDHERAVREATRLQWAPALDGRWLRTADLLEVARVWGAAVPYAGNDPSAAEAVKKCEARLRQLHPHGMSHYDRLRGQGLGPAEAMREAAVFFARDPNVRTGHPAPARRALLAASENLTPADAARLAQGDFPLTVDKAVQATRTHEPSRSASRPVGPTQRPGQNIKQ